MATGLFRAPQILLACENERGSRLEAGSHVPEMAEANGAGQEA